MRIINAGEKSIYINSFGDLIKDNPPLIIEFMSAGNIQRFLSELFGRWLANSLQQKNDNIFWLQEEETTTGAYPKNRIFELKVGKDLLFYNPDDHNVCPQEVEWIDFLKKGEKFYIEDNLGKRYYLPRLQVWKVKKDLGI